MTSLLEASSSKDTDFSADSDKSPPPKRKSHRRREKKSRAAYEKEPQNRTYEVNSHYTPLFPPNWPNVPFPYGQQPSPYSPSWLQSLQFQGQVLPRYMETVWVSCSKLLQFWLLSSSRSSGCRGTTNLSDGEITVQPENPSDPILGFYFFAWWNYFTVYTIFSWWF